MQIQGFELVFQEGTVLHRVGMGFHGVMVKPAAYGAGFPFLGCTLVGHGLGFGYLEALFCDVFQGLGFG